MALNTIVAGRAWLYSHNVGRQAQAGMGFSQPVAVAATKDGVLYVANRSGEQNPSSRISKVTIDHEFINEFGRQGPVYGGNNKVNLFSLVSGNAVDKKGKCYAAAEWERVNHVF